MVDYATQRHIAVRAHRAGKMWRATSNKDKTLAAAFTCHLRLERVRLLDRVWFDAADEVRLAGAALVDERRELALELRAERQNLRLLHECMTRGQKHGRSAFASK